MVYLILAILAYIVIAAIYTIIKGAVLKGRQKKLDQIAHEMFSEFDFEKEREQIKEIGSRYLPKEYICPKCKGMLVVRNGIYGEFLGCNRYPECKYTRNFKP